MSWSSQQMPKASPEDATTSPSGHQPVALTVVPSDYRGGAIRSGPPKPLTPLMGRADWCA